MAAASLRAARPRCLRPSPDAWWARPAAGGHTCRRWVGGAGSLESAFVPSASCSDSLVAKEPLAFEYLRRILNAKVYDVCRQTPLQHAPVVSKKIENRVLLKREDQQDVYSFKLRGAYNKIVHLSPEEKARGICACSAGNHAQGVAYSASKLGLAAKIFMPKTTPTIKVNAVQAYANDQSEVILVGSTYDEAHAATEACVKEEGRVLIHPFNDPLVIAGQGTIGLEVLAQTTQEDVDAVFCPVGGGGLLAGVGVFLKSVKPRVKVIGVEAIDSAAMTSSFAADRVVELPSVGLFADGVAVRKVGDESFRVCQMSCDEMVTVSTDEICSAIKDAFVDTRVLLEPAGALALAGLKKYAERAASKGKTFVAITSGANMDFDRLRFVSERADTSETTIAVQIPERAGSILELYRCIYPRNVTELSYRYSDGPASVFMSFQAPSLEDRLSVMRELESQNLHPLNLGDNDIAETHVRHMVGGRAPAVATREEALFSFQFPEYPGSLLSFLEHLPQDFDVSLFHYRSHGADVARVLVAFKVPAKTRCSLRDYLDYLTSQGFTWKEETTNPAYHRFLLEPVAVNTSGRSRPRAPPPLFLSSYADHMGGTGNSTLPAPPSMFTSSLLPDPGLRAHPL